jgi:CRISPR-associated endoribonuclease Cas6
MLGPNFKLAKYTFHLEAGGDLDLPVYKGSTFRGAFGHAFRRVVCIRRERECDGCIVKGKCVYSYVFETPLPPDAKMMRKYAAAPHPFILCPPLESKRRYEAGDIFSFDFTLIGRAIEYLPYFIYTFEELGTIGLGKDRGKFKMNSVTVHSGKPDMVEIYDGKSKTLKSDYSKYLIPNLQSSIVNPQSLNLIFMTPTRLSYDESLVHDLEFHILVRNLLRRISLLSYFHCGEELKLDFKGLIDKAKEIKVKKSNLKWYDWERLSNRQNTKIKMGGLVGKITFEGELSEFMPLVQLGEYVHLGKSTSFGMGKYQII